MRVRHPISFFTILILAYVIFRVAHLYPRWDNKGAEATLSWDVYGYYLYLPAAFIYDDLAYLSFKDEMFEKYRHAADFQHGTLQADGKYVLKYPIGMAVLYLPFFFLAHVFASFSDVYAADGFSLPYQMAISWGMILYAILGLFIARRILLEFFSDKVVAATLAILVLATNYLNYSAFDGAMPHNSLFTLNALLIWLTILWHKKPRWWIAGLIGLTIGLATIVRPIELMTCLIPLGWGVWNKESFLAKLNLIKDNWQHILILIAGMVVMGSIQMIYWKIHSGHFLYYSYGKFGFDWTRPHIMNGIFSYRKGWFIYTPVMVLSVLGLITLFQKHRETFWLVAGYLALTLYVVFAWEVWWYGGSFGARPLVQTYALLTLPLAAFLNWAFDRKVTLAIVAVFAFLCADLNLMMTWQAHARGTGWEAEFMTRPYYWKLFGNPRPEKDDAKYLDVRRNTRDLAKFKVKTLYHNDFEADTTANRDGRHPASGQWAVLVNKDHPFSPGYTVSLGALKAKKDSWIRVSVNVLYENMEWNVWQQGQLSVIFFRNGQPYKQTTCRIQRTTDPWRMHHLFYDMQLPQSYEPTDELKVYVWGANSDQELFVDDLKVELLEPAS
ncbi:MAG: hypothetical protein AAF206_07385 [Bacteroidota bacterium]